MPPTITRQTGVAIAALACAALLAGCGGSSSGPAAPTIAPARTFRIGSFHPAGLVRAGVPTKLSFTILQPSGEPLTRFRRGAGPHTGVHVIIVRSDLSALVHVHPPIDAAGRVAETVTLPAPGRYRIVVDVYPADGAQRNFQLFRTLRVAGSAVTHRMPPFARSVVVDGYRFTLAKRPRLRAISPALMTVTVRRPDGAAPRLTPWFGALAHAIFFRAGSLDYVHTHVCGAGSTGCTSSVAGASVTGSAGAPGTLRVGVLVPVGGTWRVFLQCRVDGKVLTAPFTLAVSG